MSSSGMKIELAYVVDTNALLWYLTSHRRLGKHASEVFAAAERGETQIIISAITIAEMYYANKKQALFADFRQTYRNLKANPQYQFEPFLADHVLDFDTSLAVPEMHDRIIAGLARRIGAPLLTSDPLITAAGIATIIW